MRAALVLGVAFLVAASALGDFIVAPNAYAAQGGPYGLSTQFHYAGRTYQAAINPSELAAIPDEAQIIGFTWRIRAVPTYLSWPTTDITFANYDVQVSKSNYPAGSLSTTFAANIGGDVVMARSGPLTLPAYSFPGGAEWPPRVNDFGYEIMFTTPYTYHSGDTLLFTVRHTGNGVSAYTFLDSIANSTIGQALGAVGYTAATGSAAYFSIMKIIYIPEPATLSVLVAAGALLRRR